MRYVINDDDLEDWYSKLYQINKELGNLELEYILDEMERELHQHISPENFNDFLKSLQGELE